MTALKSACLMLALGCALSGGCASWRGKEVLPERHIEVRDQLIIYSDAPLPRQHRLLDEVVAQRTVVSTKLALPLSDEPIHVYLFSTSDEFRNFMRLHYPSLPQRRAFFVESDTRLMVYAYWGDRVAEDLRHEVTHGYLHALVPRIPLWLDEGLAEYFEVPRSDRGLNRPHVQQLAAAHGWRPNLRRLEELTDTAAMTQIDYAEAWAWVHLLLETTPDRVGLLQSDLQLLHNNEAAEPLSNQLRRQGLDYDALLIEHVNTLRQGLR